MDIDAGWGLPWDSENANDTEAVLLSATTAYGQYGDPIFFGKYPDYMVE